MTSTISPDDVSYLDEVDDDKFESIVRAHLHHDGSQSIRRTWDALCHPTVADRTLGCLTELQGQPHNAADSKAIVGRLNLVRGRIHSAILRADRLAYRDLMRRLAHGINQHRLAAIDAGFEPEPHDIALWGLLDDLRLPAGEQSGSGPSLASMLLDGPWSGGAACEQRGGEERTRGSVGE